MVRSTYTEFALSPCPWVPDQPFWEQNAAEVRDIMALVAEDYPPTAQTVNFDPTVLPGDEQRRALWKLFMGRQHGVQELSDGKVVIPPEREGVYRGVLDKIHYGPHTIMGAVALDTSVEYHQAALNGGTPIENLTRLNVALDAPERGENVQNIVALTGQRLRGIWNVPGEHSVRDLFDVVGQRTGTDMDELATRSPWVQSELQRTGEDWFAPFATEWELYRLAGEARLFDRIDWRNYVDTVRSTPPVGPNEIMHYTDQGRTVTVPPREHGMVSYDLKNGQRWHVVNGAASARPHGIPRATSTSIAEEAMDYLEMPENARMVAVSGAPHLRAAADTAIAYLHKRGPEAFSRVDVAAGEWAPEITNIVAALGELMATMKADFRLREVLRGGDPNKPELAAI